MTKKRKWIISAVAAVIVAALATGVGIVLSVPALLRDLYGQWDTAELVIRFHRQEHRLPLSWNDLQQVYSGSGSQQESDGKSNGLRGGMSLPQLEETIVIDFTRLPELQQIAQSGLPSANLPKVVHTRSGRRSHWNNAEPNQLIYDYFRETRNNH